MATEMTDPLYEDDEIDLKELFSVIYAQKWLIMFITLFFIVTTAFYAYTKVETYESYCIGKVEVKSKSTMPNDLFAGMGSSSNDDLDKQIALYKTFFFSEKVLELFDLEVQYFEENNLKTIEYYDKKPITVKDINLVDKSYISDEFRITPKDNNHFTLEIRDSGIFKKIKFKNSYKYGELVKIDGISFIINKNDHFSKACILHFNGTKRDIYERIIKNSLHITRIDKQGDLIKISFRDSIEKRAKDFVTTLAEVISVSDLKEKSDENEEVLESINIQLDEIKNKLNLQEKQIQDYKIKHDYVKPDEQSNAIVSKISKVDSDLTKESLKYALIEDIESSINSSLSIIEASLSISELGDAKTTSLFSSIKILLDKKRNLSTRFTQDYPDMIELDEEINIMKNQITSNITNLKFSVKNKIDRLTIIKQNAQNKLSSIPKKQTKMENLNRHRSVDDKMYDYLLQQKSEREIKKSSIKSNFKLVDKAYTDRGSVNPKKALMIVVAAISGFILGIFLVFFREFINDSIKNVKMIKDLTTLPILGVIPKLKKRDIKLEVFEDKNSEFSESFRELKDNISSGFSSSCSKAILLTSTLSGEGKTLMAVNLACTLSQSGQKCVIINLDLRRPKLHEYFSVDATLGVSNYLEGGYRLDEIIQKTGHKNLDLITAGEIPLDPSEILAKDELAGLLIYLRESYDYIIIDSPAMSTKADTYKLLGLVDLSLFIIRKGVSKKEYIESLNKLVKSKQIDNFAIIANEMDDESHEFLFEDKHIHINFDLLEKSTPSKKSSDIIPHGNRRRIDTIS